MDVPCSSALLCHIPPPHCRRVSETVLWRFWVPRTYGGYLLHSGAPGQVCVCVCCVCAVCTMHACVIVCVCLYLCVRVCMCMRVWNCVRMSVCLCLCTHSWIGGCLCEHMRPLLSFLERAICSARMSGLLGECGTHSFSPGDHLIGLSLV